MIRALFTVWLALLSAACGPSGGDQGSVGADAIGAETSAASTKEERSAVAVVVAGDKGVDVDVERGLGAETSAVRSAGSGEEIEATTALKSRVKVRLSKALGSVDRGAITRVLVRVAKRCHARALRGDPALVGRLELKFSLVGDHKGPMRVAIGGEQSLPTIASCLRKEMAQERWPTGYIDGVGLFEARVDFELRE